jgi:hypothetical protein
MDFIDDVLCVCEFSLDTDECLYNSTSVNDSDDPCKGLKKSIIYEHCEIAKSLDCRVSSMVDNALAQWTVFSFEFLFNSSEEYRAGGFESLLRNGIALNSCWSPIIIVRKSIKDCLVHDSNDYGYNDIYRAQPKTLRPIRSEICLEYELYIKGTVRPLHKLFDMGQENTSSLDTLRGLRDSVLMSFDRYLQVLLLLVVEIGHVHSEGLCHNSIEASAFAVYHIPAASTAMDNSRRISAKCMYDASIDKLCESSPLRGHAPSSCAGNTGQEQEEEEEDAQEEGDGEEGGGDGRRWGVQLLGQWQCTPSGALEGLTEQAYICCLQYCA